MRTKIVQSILAAALLMAIKEEISTASHVILAKSAAVLARGGRARGAARRGRLARAGGCLNANQHSCSSGSYSASWEVNGSCVARIRKGRRRTATGTSRFFGELSQWGAEPVCGL